jgi:hypothetical protein
MVDAGTDVTIASNTVSDTNTTGIAILNTVTGTVTVTSNILKDMNRAALSYVDAIYIQSGSLLTSGTVTGNALLRADT